MVFQPQITTARWRWCVCQFGWVLLMAGAGAVGLGDLHLGIAQRDANLVNDQLNAGSLLTVARLKGALS